MPNPQVNPQHRHNHNRPGTPTTAAARNHDSQPGFPPGTGHPHGVRASLAGLTNIKQPQNPRSNHQPMTPITPNRTRFPLFVVLCRTSPWGPSGRSSTVLVGGRHWQPSVRGSPTPAEHPSAPSAPAPNIRRGTRRRPTSNSPFTPATQLTGLRRRPDAHPANRGAGPDRHPRPESGKSPILDRSVAPSHLPVRC